MILIDASKISDKQDAFLRDEHRHVAYGGARGGGGEPERTLLASPRPRAPGKNPCSFPRERASAFAESAPHTMTADRSKEAVLYLIGPKVSIPQARRDAPAPPRPHPPACSH